MTQLISSLTNDRVKALRSLERKKNRSETGLFLAEGPRLVQQGLDKGWDLATLAISEDALNRNYISALASRAEAIGADVFCATEKVMGKIARKENPNAVIGAFRQSSSDLDSLAISETQLLLALYEVRDPGNLGTVIRTADCAGVAGIVLVGSCCDPFSIESVRATMGSIFDVPLIYTDFEAFSDWRRQRGRTMVAAVMNGDRRHDQVDFTTPSILLMGNEQSGLPDHVEHACDVLTRIPMRGGADSLNLAQATAILVYEAWRQAEFVGHGQ